MAVVGISVGSFLIIYGYIQSIFTVGRILAGFGAVLEASGLLSATSLVFQLITLKKTTQDQKKVSSRR
jgi:hypothetical protein